MKSTRHFRTFRGAVPLKLICLVLLAYLLNYFRTFRGAVPLKPFMTSLPSANRQTDFRTFRGAVPLKQWDGGLVDFMLAQFPHLPRCGPIEAEESSR